MIVLQTLTEAEWWIIEINAIITLIVALVGVYVGYILAKKHDLKQREEETSNKIQLAKQILANELKILKSGVDGYYESKKDAEKMHGKGGIFQPNMNLSTDCKDSIVNTGYFILLDRSLQNRISNIYSIVAQAKYLIPGFHEIHIKHLENIGKKDTQEALSKAMKNQSEKLEIQLNELKTKIEEIERKLPAPETD